MRALLLLLVGASVAHAEPPPPEEREALCREYYDDNLTNASYLMRQEALAFFGLALGDCPTEIDEISVLFRGGADDNRWNGNMDGCTPAPWDINATHPMNEYRQVLVSWAMLMNGRMDGYFRTGPEYINQQGMDRILADWVQEVPRIVYNCYNVPGPVNADISSAGINIYPIAFEMGIAGMMSLLAHEVGHTCAHGGGSHNAGPYDRAFSLNGWWGAQQNSLLVINHWLKESTVFETFEAFENAYNLPPQLNGRSRVLNARNQMLNRMSTELGRFVIQPCLKISSDAETLGQLQADHCTLEDIETKFENWTGGCTPDGSDSDPEPEPDPEPEEPECFYDWEYQGDELCTYDICPGMDPWLLWCVDVGDEDPDSDEEYDEDGIVDEDREGTIESLCVIDGCETPYIDGRCPSEGCWYPLTKPDCDGEFQPDPCQCWESCERP